MVNKSIAWLVVSATFIFWIYGYNLVDTLTDDDSMMGALIFMVIVAYMMGRSPVPDGNTMTTIIESMKGFLVNIVWLTVATLVFEAFLMVVEGGFDPMRLVHATIFMFTTLVTSALMFSAIGAAMKD